MDGVDGTLPSATVSRAPAGTLAPRPGGLNVDCPFAGSFSASDACEIELLSATGTDWRLSEVLDAI
jgi:hypothetical protein